MKYSQKQSRFASASAFAMRDIACAAGAALGGKWSVDILDTERGWFLTDMAPAELSYGWKAS